MELVPSPKSQLQLVMLSSASVLVSVNEQLISTQSKLNDATGGTPGSMSVSSCLMTLVRPPA